MLNKVWEIQGSFGLENLKQTTRDLSESLAPKEVLVRLTATSLNYRDYLMVIGTYNPRQKLPLVPCSDGAGIVEAVGSEVSLWKRRPSPSDLCPEVDGWGTKYGQPSFHPRWST